ncbi:uncharacterized protein LOC113502825 isoform X1 [Trichoplusia ni]|uniref:TIMELESS-interacting protein n=1 Tax=Trichoplusia ni TaxID=7111 RepID=A0A7E5WI26_TRINI|nr:uncharacterized protein LOC113502825 isoform X1 [Trichoplusia ni]
MSLLEDVFLQDEADEAQELERVIEGDEYDERPRSRSATPEEDENVIGEDEAEEDKRRVEPTSSKTKRVIKNPRFILNPARLTGPRGIQVIREHFKDFKFKGKGHEKEDLDMVLKKLEHWAYRLYPKFQFEDCLKKIEALGRKRPVMVHLSKIRSDQILTEETVVQKDSSDEETQNEPPQEEDEFDKLLQQQIEIARATPAPGSVKKVMDTPRQERSPFTMPKATSSPSISDEQKERMIRNRKLAEERRLARLEKLATEASKPPSINIVDADGITTEHNITKKNRSNVIDSSDEECNVTAVNQSVSVDMHANTSHSHDKEANKSIESKNTEAEQTLDVDMDISDKVNSLQTNREQITGQENVSDKKTLNNGENGDIPVNNIEDMTDRDKLGMSNGENGGKVDLHNVSDKGDILTDVVEGMTDNDKVNDDIDLGIGTNKGENSSNNVKEYQETDETNKELANHDDISIINTKEPEISEEHSANISNNENRVQSQSEDEILNEIIEEPEKMVTKNVQTAFTQSTSGNNKDMIENVNTAEVEDIMDVDFSDDF